MITSVKYLLYLALPQRGEYQGYVDIKLTLGEKNHGVFLDYSGTEVGMIKINNNEVEASEVFYRHRIKIPFNHQVVGENSVLIITN